MRFRRDSAALVLLHFLVQLVVAINLEKNFEPTGPLKIRLDYALATKRGKSAKQADHEYVFTSHLKFKKAVNEGGISDGQLVQMTIDAHKEMPVNFKLYKPKDSSVAYPDGTPSVMTALAFGNEIIFASSQKGGLSFISSVGTSKVWKQLTECQVLWNRKVGRDEDHKHARHCGEIMALQQYYALYGDREIAEFTGRARMLSIILDTDENENPKSWDVHNPCGGNGEPTNPDPWGCGFFVEMRNADVDIVPKGTDGEPYDLGTLAGGSPIIDMIGVCSKPPK